MTSPSGPAGSGTRDDGNGMGDSLKARTCSLASRRGNGKRPAFRLDGHALVGLGRALDPAGQDQVPKMALKRREIERAELAAQPGESPAKIGWVIDQVGHDAASGRTFEPGLRLRPFPPMSTQNGFLSLDSRTVEWIGLGQGQLERTLMIAGQPGMSDELPAITDRAKPLIVEIVGETIAG